MRGGKRDAPRTVSDFWLSKRRVEKLCPQMGRLGNKPDGGGSTEAGFQSCWVCVAGRYPGGDVTSCGTSKFEVWGQNLGWRWKAGSHWQLGGIKRHIKRIRLLGEEEWRGEETQGLPLGKDITHGGEKRQVA